MLSSVLCLAPVNPDPCRCTGYQFWLNYFPMSTGNHVHESSGSEMEGRLIFIKAKQVFADLSGIREVANR